MSQFKLRAVTLLELLVVVVLISILSAFIFSMFKSVRQKTHMAQCSANLNRIGIALTQFATDHDNRWPEVSHADDETTWYARLLPYLDENLAVGISPADPLAKERQAIGMSSYIFNEYLAVPLKSPFGAIKEDYRNRTLLPEPSKIIVLLPIADGIGLNAARDHTHSRKWVSWRAVSADIQADRFRTGDSDAERKKGTANYLFADGHVETLVADSLRRQLIAIDSLQRESMGKQSIIKPTL